LIDYTEKGEEKVIAALISREQNISFEEVLKISDRMTAEEKKEFFKSLMGNMQPWDRAPREFELVDFTFELIVSSSCFAQLKRHRMATILVSDYEPELGITIPPSIESIGMQDLLIEAANLSEKLYNKIIKRTPYAAPYVLTNSHRRRVIFKVNARELYHFSRLREDESAQWDIRNLAKEIIKIAKEKMPSLFLLTCGKDKFEKI
jgi:thymidylate synthase ThyX